MKPKGPKNRFTVVSWINPEQFNKVYDYLYSDSLSKKRWAVDEISVWNTRCHPSLPTAIEATVGIVRATIHDMLCQADKTFCQEEDIKLLYGMALIRFVNLTLEHHQKANSKIRMSVLAAKCNIPSWLIDLRNEAVHSYYPSLSVLRFGADKALRYLKESFWSKEAANVKPIINLPPPQETEIIALIKQYKTVQFQRLADKKLSRQLSKDFKAVLKKTSFFLSHYGEKFIDILVQPGNFISATDLKTLVGEKAKELERLILPIELPKCWEPLLCQIYSKELMPKFLEKLLLAQEKVKNKICQKIAVAWAMKMFWTQEPGSRLTLCYQKKGLLLNVPSLVYACVKGASSHAKELLSILVADDKNVEKYSKLFLTLALYQGYFIPTEESSQKRKRDPDMEIVFSVEDVEEELNEIKAKKMRVEEEVNIWSSPSVAMDFSDVPIGGVINPAIPESPDEQADDSWKELIKLEPSVDDDFIIVNKSDGEGTVEDILPDINTLPVTTRPENFDMVYRRRPN